MIKNNRRGQAGDTTLIVMFFIILVTIFVGIYLAISKFYEKKYDFRLTDAYILNEKIKNCIKNSNINFSLPQEALYNEIYSVCKLNRRVIEENFYVELKINDDIKFKVRDVGLCVLSEKNKNFPLCKSTIFGNKGDAIYLTTGSVQRSTEELG